MPDSAAVIRIVEHKRIDENVTFIINPYDEHAIEEARRLRAADEKSEVIAVCAGRAAAAGSLQAALAMGADRGIHVTIEEPVDSLVTALALKAAILADGRPDIIFTGKQSIDAEGFQTMFRLAAALDMPAAANVTAFALQEGAARVECAMEAGGRSVLRMPLPCIIAAGKALNTPRYPTLPDIMRARSKPVQTMTLASLQLPAPAAGMEIIALRPAVENRRRHVIDGSGRQAVAELVRLLHEEARVI